MNRSYGPTEFGTFDSAYTQKATKSQHKLRSNLVPVCLNLLAPWFLFVIVYSAMTFSLRYWSPAISWIIFAVCFLTVIAAASVACIMSVLRKPHAAPPTTHPAWHCLLFILLALALVLGTVLGDLNYRHNFLPYYDVMSLNSYDNVNPYNQSSHQMMDAGQVVFQSGVVPDLTRAMAFKSRNMYCVTPIIANADAPEPPSGTYDFWAVGMNCCSESRRDFHCGAYANPLAHAGLRVVDENKQPFFRLAVQQAEAAYGIQAPHPILLMWLKDPSEEMAIMQKVGMHYFYVGLYSHLIWQVVVVVLALLALTKVGWQMSAGALKQTTLIVS